MWWYMKPARNEREVKIQGWGLAIAALCVIAGVAYILAGGR